MMKNKMFICLIFLMILLAGILVGKFIVNFRYDEPYFEDKSCWYSEELDADFVVENGCIQGSLIVDGEKREVTVHTKAGYIHMCIKDIEGSDEHFFLKGRYKLKNNDSKIIVNKIKYMEDSGIDLGIDEFTLIKCE